MTERSVISLAFVCKIFRATLKTCTNNCDSVQRRSNIRPSLGVVLSMLILTFSSVNAQESTDGVIDLTEDSNQGRANVGDRLQIIAVVP